MKLLKDLGVIYLKETSKTKRRCGIYECPDCGIAFTVQTSNVKAGKSTKCRTCSAKKCNITHGLKNHPLYVVWTNMKSRCYNKNNSRYSTYGAEGVTVCREWRQDFKAFYDWAIEHNYSPEKRIDKDILCEQQNIAPKVYSPKTCKFVDQTTNSQATRILNTVNTSGYRGVSIKKGRTTNRFVAQISVTTNKIHIGYFSTALEAARAYDYYITINNLKHTRNFKCS